MTDIHETCRQEIARLEEILAKALDENAKLTERNAALLDQLRKSKIDPDFLAA